MGPRPPFAVLAATTFLAGLAACASGPTVEDAPLAETRQKKLQQALVGNWRATHRIPEGGTREPLEGKTSIWQFRSDGTGKYAEGVGVDSDSAESFAWRLEGRNLMLKFDSDRPDQYYRAETWSAAQMKWWDYRKEETLVLRGAVMQSKPDETPEQPGESEESEDRPRQPDRRSP